MATLTHTFLTPIDHETAYDALKASDLADEAVSATADDYMVEVYSDSDGEHALSILWLPEIGRAGIVTTQGTGTALWTDALSPGDAARRFREDDLNP